MRKSAFWLPVLCAALAAALAARPVSAAAPAKVKEIAWQWNFPVATVAAQKADKLMLVYFSGSDWDEYTQKLEKEVLKTPMVLEWVEKNVVPVQVDRPKDKKVSVSVKNQTEALIIRYGIAKVPTFLLVDTSGEVLARFGYDTMKLRDSESKDQPKAAVEYLDAVLKSRPPPEKLTTVATLREGVASAKAHGVPLLVMITQHPTDALLRERDAITRNQQFVRFVNRNMTFVQVDWPEELDKTPDAQFARDFATKWQFGPGPLKLVLWTPGGLGSLKYQFNTITSAGIATLVRDLDAQLPRIDYDGGWVEDWKLARAISAQQKKDILVAFVSMNGSEWSQKMDGEVFQSKEFLTYAHANMVLMRADYPKKGPAAVNTVGTAAAAPTGPAAPATTQKSPYEIKELMKTGPNGEQPPALGEQNRMLAEMYGVRGYPTLIILNDKVQKIGDAKYQKGGVAIFMKELDALRKKDRERRTLISEQEAAK